MKSSKIAIAALAAAAVLTASAGGARAQVTTAPAIHVKVKQPKTLKWFKGEVLHADQLSIIVRDRQDPRFIRTFTYSPKVKEEMDKILERGGFQYGDKVQIRYQPDQSASGKDVALDIRGRPSKAL